MSNDIYTNVADARAYGAAFGVLAANAQAAADAFQNAFHMAINVLAGRPTIRPRIVVLCGSTRFIDAFREANLRETLAGRIVLSIGCNMRSDAEIFGGMHDGELAIVKTNLDELHKRKIDLADEVLVLNVGGYIGDSTRSEIAYAEALGKPIRWLEPTDPGGRAAEANQDSDGETTACPCDQFCPDGERCDGLTTQEAVAQLNAEQRADEADDLGQASTKPAAENRCAHCGDAIYLIDGAWKHRPGLRSPHDPEPANLASH